MSESHTAVRAEVRGLVQGVGYRQSVVERAREVGAVGWVRDEDDGSVRAHIEGSDDAVAELVAFLREGPPGASVASAHIDAVKVEGHEQFAIRGVPAGRFVVDATGDGFAVRLQVDGAWRSWAMRKAPSMVPAERRFASLIDAPGHDPAAQVWDSGTYEQGGRVAWPQAIERGHAVFVLHGEQLRGGFALQRTSGTQWLLIKRRDEFAQ